METVALIGLGIGILGVVVWMWWWENGGTDPGQTDEQKKQEDTHDNI